MPERHPQPKARHQARPVRSSISLARDAQGSLVLLHRHGAFTHQDLATAQPPPAHLGIYLEVIKRRGTIYGRRLPPSPFPRQMRWPLRRTPAFSSSPSSRPVRSIATYAAMPWRRLVLRQGLGTHHRAPGEEVPSTDAEAMIVFRPPICCLAFPVGTPGRWITPATSRPRLRTPAQHHYRNDASSRRKPVRRLSTTQDSSAGAILN